MPTPESLASSPAITNFPTAWYSLDNALAENSEPATCPRPEHQDESIWGEQVPPIVEPATYQPQPNYDGFVPSLSQFQPAYNPQLPSDLFTFQSPIPAPSFTTGHSAMNASIPSQIFNTANVPSGSTHPSSTVPKAPAPSPLVRSQSALGPQARDTERKSHKRLLQRALSTASSGSSVRGSNKRHKGSTWDRHPSIPQGNWEQELIRLELNREGKYFHTPRRPRSSLTIKGDAVKQYACLYVSPYNPTPCWKRPCWDQPKEWLLEVSGGSRQKVGFFPRHEAEMLRHLALHRVVDVRITRRMINQVKVFGTVWQDQLIDEQIIKDRDDPDNQIWYPDEKRKSRDELNDQLAFSSLYQN